MTTENEAARRRKISILFLCTGNSCRSQMAEGWARHLHAEVIEPYSAGIEKHGLNTLAVRGMAEAGVDISAQRSKVLEELPIAAFDYVVGFEKELFQDRLRYVSLRSVASTSAIFQPPSRVDLNGCCAGYD